MEQDDKKFSQIRKLLEEIEEKVHTVRRIMFEQVYQEEAERLDMCNCGPITIIEGVFDGQEMIDKDGKKYNVPSNYASKSKLIAGDKLKLTINSEGVFVFKQIGPVERKRSIGKLQKVGEKWHILCDGKKYQCLAASVTYFKAKAGDRVTAILPKIGESDWASIDNLSIEKGK